MGEIKIDPIKNVHDKYNKVNIINPYRFGGGGSSYEPETVAYMAAVGIADDTTVYYSGTPQEITGNGFYVAVDTFIKSLKTEGIFSKMKAVYPMIGGNASTHKWNLMNPQNTDSAFRMVWFGAGIHSRTGFRGNGTNSYGDTRYNQLSNSILNNESFGIYVRITNIEPSPDFGVGGSANQNTYIASTQFSNIFVRSQNQSSYSTSNTLPGYFSVSRKDGFRVQKNNTFYNITDRPAVGLANLTFRLGSNNFDGVSTVYSQKEYSYAFIGEGLNQSEMTTHYNAVQQLQTDLKRHI